MLDFPNSNTHHCVSWTVGLLGPFYAPSMLNFPLEHLELTPLPGKKVVGCFRQSFKFNPFEMAPPFFWDIPSFSGVIDSVDLIENSQLENLFGFWEMSDLHQLINVTLKGDNEWSNQYRNSLEIHGNTLESNVKSSNCRLPMEVCHLEMG